MSISAFKLGTNDNLFLLNRVLVFCSIIFLLASPRLVIIEIGGSSVRLEDVVIGLLAAYVGLNWKEVIRTGVKPGPIFLVIVVSITSAAVAQISENVPLGSGLLYAIRPLEYWVIAPFILVTLVHGKSKYLSDIELALKCVTVLQTAFAVAQYFFNFSVGFSSFSNERGAGLTKGPYELGAIALMLCIYWLYRKQYLFAVIGFLGLITSLSRVSILAMLICSVAFCTVFVTNQIRQRKFTLPTHIWIFSLAGVALTSLLVATYPSNLFAPLFERVGSTNLVETWARTSILAGRIPGPLSVSEYMQLAYVDFTDVLKSELLLPGASDYVRFFRWNLLINQFVLNPINVIFGLGPSFAGPSVDGSYLRIIVEGGIIGLVAWISLFTQWFKKQQNWFRYISISLLISMIFIDSLYSLRIMVLFWLFFALSKFGEIHFESNK